MKSYEQRREAVIRVLGDVDYEQTDAIIEAFFDGDDLFYKSNPQRDGTYHYVKLEPKR